MSNIIPLSSDSIVQDMLQCSLCAFATSNRSKFTEHLISQCTPERNNLNNIVLAHLPVFKSSSLNQDDCSPFTKYIETENTNKSSLRISNPQSRDRCFREAKNCKQCNFIANTKMEYWEHMRCHIKGFTCSECSFVTKYKHHMNHHWLSVHDGSKPFKCKKCLYTCVSKSMLTSHLKKHSNIYPYRCADCTYKTKFCNALKKHLRKKEHQSAMVLNADGSSVVDVYGTKRGPKQKFAKNQKIVATNQLDDSAMTPLSLHSSVARYLTAINGVNNGINRNDINKNQSTFPYSDLVAAFNLSNHVLFREDATFVDKNVQDHAQSAKNAGDKMPFDQSLIRFETTNYISESHTSNSVKANESFVKTQLECQRIESIDVPLDLRIADVIKKNQLVQANMNSSKVPSKRKGKAIKLRRHLIKENMVKKQNVSSESNRRPDFSKVSQKVKNEVVADLFEFTCHYCEIIFGNVIMYAVHMGCHSFDDPYTCNICGHQCTDKLSFFLHIARSEH